MILPPGQSVKSAIDLASLDFPALLSELAKKKFTGYLAITVKGAGGIEEGTLIYDGGKIVACTYEYLRHNALVLGSGAFPRVVNASAAKKGIVDLFQLTSEQVKLTIAFNEQMVFVPQESDLANINPAEFSPFFEEQVCGGRGEDKAQILKRLKLGGAVEKEGEGELPPSADKAAPEDYDMFEKLIKKE
jgi:hypothetical protein